MKPVATPAPVATTPPTSAAEAVPIVKLKMVLLMTTYRLREGSRRELREATAKEKKLAAEGADAFLKAIDKLAEYEAAQTDTDDKEKESDKNPGSAGLEKAAIAAATKEAAIKKEKTAVDAALDAKIAEYAAACTSRKAVQEKLDGKR